MLESCAVSPAQLTMIDRIEPTCTLLGCVVLQVFACLNINIFTLANQVRKTSAPAKDVTRSHEVKKMCASDSHDHRAELRSSKMG